MDKTDVILCQLLLGNSRLSYRELAAKLDLSVTAVHKRIQSLIDEGVIRKFTTSLSVHAKNAIHVIIFGATKTYSIQKLKLKLEKHGSINWLAVAGGNVLYIGAYLRHTTELEALVRYVKENAEIPAPTVGLTFSPILPFIKNVKTELSLCDLDYRIIRSLQDDSRKATSDIAAEVGVSAKTVRRRLTWMIKNFLISFSIEWYPDASNDIISIFHVNLSNDATPNSPNIILQKYYPNALFYWGFSNLPTSYIYVAWTPTSKELRELRENLEAEPAIQSLVPNVIYTGYIFKIWVNEIP